MIELDALVAMWEEGANIPVNDDGYIEEPWAGFPAGSHREDVWHWFEEQNPEFSVAKAHSGAFRKNAN